MLRRQQVKPSSNRGSRIVRVRVDERVLHVAPDHVLEVIHTPDVTRVPADDPGTIGLVLHRDALIPVIEIGHRLGQHKAVDVNRRHFCVIAKSPEGIVGVQVDDVLGLASATTSGQPLEIEGMHAWFVEPDRVGIDLVTEDSPTV